jgi:signal transduction histidine kinase
MKEHGGALTFTSAAGTGTVVRLTLPIPGKELLP